jgi:hypothetical protein
MRPTILSALDSLLDFNARCLYCPLRASSALSSKDLLRVLLSESCPLLSTDPPAGLRDQRRSEVVSGPPSVSTKEASPATWGTLKSVRSSALEVGGCLPARAIPSSRPLQGIEPGHLLLKGPVNLPAVSSTQGCYKRSAATGDFRLNRLHQGGFPATWGLQRLFREGHLLPPPRVSH